jgi:hypothetical protein
MEMNVINIRIHFTNTNPNAVLNFEVNVDIVRDVFVFE